MLVYLEDKVYICIMLEGGVISLLGRGNTLKYIFRHIILSAAYNLCNFLNNSTLKDVQSLSIFVNVKIAVLLDFKK